jgi:hypothetical protein
MLDAFLEGAAKNNSQIEKYDINKLNIKACTGCLRCNLIKSCSIRNDDWSLVSKSILDADVLVFAGPVYFHHFPGSVKVLLDRFRSFINVKITQESLIHTAWHNWQKDFVLLLSMGSSDSADAKPIIELFEFMCEILGSQNKLHVITATRLAVSKQISFNATELQELYKKLGLPQELAINDADRNRDILRECGGAFPIE